MKDLFNRSTRRNGLLAALGLVVVGSIVVGDENKRKEEHVVSQRAATPQMKALPQAEELDLSPLRRAKPEGPIADPFAPRSARKEIPATIVSPSVGASAPSVVEVAPPPPPPPPPAAPPLPFRYLGKVVNDGNTSVYVVSGDKDHAAAPGSVIDGAYRVEALSETAIVFTYLPLGLQQTLSIAEAPER